MRARLCLFIFATLPVAALPSFAAAVGPVVNDNVTDQYRPIPLERQNLSGLLASRIRANIEGYLEPQGHNGSAAGDPGTYLEAAANSFDYTHDRNLGAAMEHVAQAVLASPADTGPAQYSRLLGLLSYYRVTGNAAALAKCKQWGNAIAGAPAVPAALESMLALYRYTGDDQYYDYCRRLVAARYPPNVTRALSAANSSDEIAQLIGLTEFYRLAGDDAFLNAATTAWRQIRDSRITATGTLNDALATPNSACATLAWLQLTFDLFRITGQPQYGDELERTTYNQLLAQQDPQTGNIFTAVPLNGTKAREPANSCTPSIARGISLLPEFVWGHYSGGIAVDFYSAGSATVRLHRGASVHLYEETSFPESGDVLLHVEPDHRIRFPLRFPIRLRVPSWADTFSVTAGSRHYTGRRGQYLVIKREWHRGDTVAIKIGMPVKFVQPTPAARNLVALERGPQILSLTLQMNPQIHDLSQVSLRTANASRVTAASSAGLSPGEWQNDQSFKVEGASAEPLMFTPFADAKTYRTTFPAVLQGSSRD